jgi:hypothetical protein
MTRPTDITGIPETAEQRLPPAGGLRLLNRPSFARALRQRGLMARATLPTSVSAARSLATGTWLAVSSIYEAHLRRLAMEQAQAVLRGDASA